MQVSVMKICFLVTDSAQLSGFFEAVSYLITFWKCLEVISIELDKSISGTQFGPSDVQAFDKDVDKLFWDDKQNFECDEFVKQLDEMRKLWIASNIQLLVFGNTVWMKKSISVNLIKRIDQIDTIRPGDSWYIRPHAATVFLFEHN